MKYPISKIKSHTRYHKKHADQGVWKSRKKIRARGMSGFTFFAFNPTLNQAFIGYQSFWKQRRIKIKSKTKLTYEEECWKNIPSFTLFTNHRDAEGFSFYHINSFENVGAMLFHHVYLINRMGGLVNESIINRESPHLTKLRDDKTLSEVHNYLSTWGTI